MPVIRDSASVPSCDLIARTGVVASSFFHLVQPALMPEDFMSDRGQTQPHRNAICSSSDPLPARHQHRQATSSRPQFLPLSVGWCNYRWRSLQSPPYLRLSYAMVWRDGETSPSWRRSSRNSCSASRIFPGVPKQLRSTGPGTRWPANGQPRHNDRRTGSDDGPDLSQQ